MLGYPELDVMLRIANALFLDFIIVNTSPVSMDLQVSAMRPSLESSHCRLVILHHLTRDSPSDGELTTFLCTIDMRNRNNNLTRTPMPANIFDVAALLAGTRNYS